MKTQAHAIFQCQSWNETEKTLDSGSGYQSSQTCSTMVYSGDLIGTSTLELQMLYLSEALAYYTGLERFEGSVLGRDGGFILEHRGWFTAGVSKSTIKIVEGTGFGALVGTRGHAAFESSHQDEYPIHFEIQFPKAK